MSYFILQIPSEEIFKTIKLGTFSMLIMAFPPISICNLCVWFYLEPQITGPGECY